MITDTQQEAVNAAIARMRRGVEAGDPMQYTVADEDLGMSRPWPFIVTHEPSTPDDTWIIDIHPRVLHLLVKIWPHMVEKTGTP